MFLESIPSLQKVLGRIRELESLLSPAPNGKKSPVSAIQAETLREPSSEGESTFLSYLQSVSPGNTELAMKKKNLPTPAILEKIYEESEKKNLDPDLVRALVQVESDFRPDAKSPKGALGLMQLMPSTAKMLGVGNPLDPMENIEGGTTYLADLMDTFRDRRLALAAYNAGPNAVYKYGGIPPFRETKEYIRKIEELLNRSDLKSSGDGKNPKS